MKIAIFDVCDTLYSTNTTFTFLDTYINTKSYRLFRTFSKSFIGKLSNYFFYKYFKIDIVRLIATKYLSNKSIEEIQSLAEDFVKNVLSKKTNSNIVNMLSDYKKNGYQIILISGAYEFIIKEVSIYFDVKKYHATKLEVLANRYTGQLSDDILLKKDEILKTIYPNFSELIVVSDNKTDLKLMKSANKAFAVCNKEKDLKFWVDKKNIIIIRNF